MRAGIVENGVIVNIIAVDEGTALSLFGAVEIAENARIGDVYVPVEPEKEPTVWDELDAAYQDGYNEGYAEGVNTAYDQ